MQLRYLEAQISRLLEDLGPEPSPPASRKSQPTLQTPKSLTSHGRVMTTTNKLEIRLELEAIKSPRPPLPHALTTSMAKATTREHSGASSSCNYSALLHSTIELEAQANSLRPFSCLCHKRYKDLLSCSKSGISPQRHHRNMDLQPERASLCLYAHPHPAITK